MKPFFSIRIDYNPADGDDMVAFDRNTIRLGLARETERDDDDGNRNYETYQNVAGKITKAIRWLCDNADPNDEGLLDALFFELRCDFKQAFLNSIADCAELGDDDEVDAMRAAIDRGIKSANESLGGEEP
jgi:hypothetical protein